MQKLTEQQLEAARAAGFLALKVFKVAIELGQNDVREVRVAVSSGDANSVHTAALTAVKALACDTGRYGLISSVTFDGPVVFPMEGAV